MLKYALPILLAAGPAFAGWQGAEWGMTQDEVRAAIDLEPEAESAEAILYRGEVAGFPLILSFQFEAGRLAKASGTSMEGEWCKGILTLLENTYGTPEKKAARSMHWRDEGNANLVDFYLGIAGDTLLSCRIGYSPIPKAAAGGF